MKGYEQFCPAGYAALITDLRGKGYDFRSYADADPAGRHVILRHDIDFCLNAAGKMADVESELGASSTYFVLLRNEFYNPFSREGLKALEHLLKLGHTIGLHFDVTLYGSEPGRIESGIERECRILESAIGCSITTLSFHRPAAHLIGSQERLAGRLNAYSPRFVKKIGYCSDSRGGWYHGEPGENPAIKEGRAMQLLIHPIWWQEPAMEPLQRLKGFLAQRQTFLERELRDNCTIYR
jgi:hypothetical protein